MKISVNKSKRRSIWIKVGLYEVFLSGIIHFPLFYFKTILTPFFPRQISGIYLTKGKEFRKYWPQGFESEADKATYERCREKF